MLADIQAATAAVGVCFISQLKFPCTHIGFRSCAFAPDICIDKGYIRVVFQCLVKYQNIVVRKGVAQDFSRIAIRVFHGGIHAVFYGIKKANAQFFAVSSRYFGGVDELAAAGIADDSFILIQLFADLPPVIGCAANSARIENISPVEKLHTFGKKLPALVKTHLKRRKIEYLLVKFHLSEVGDEGHIERKGIIDSVFEVKPTVEPFRCMNGLVGRVARNVKITRNIGSEREAKGRLYIANAGQIAHLCEYPGPIGRDFIPPAFFAVSAYIANKIDSPVLLLSPWKADGTVGNTHFYRPAAVVNAHLAGPDQVVAHIPVIRSKSSIQLHTGCRHRETRAGQPVIVGVEEDSEPIVILGIIAQSKLLQYAVGGRIVKDDPDIERLVVIQNSHFCFLS